MTHEEVTEELTNRIKMLIAENEELKKKLNILVRAFNEVTREALK